MANPPKGGDAIPRVYGLDETMIAGLPVKPNGANWPGAIR